jgi:hypothetical protein
MPAASPYITLVKTSKESEALLSSLEQAVKSLKSEIDTDKKGLLEMQNHKRELLEQKAALTKSFDKCDAFLTGIEKDGSGLNYLKKEFDNMEAFLKTEYVKLKIKHKQGIKTLQNEFKYHPAYKLGTKNEFEGVYFSPKKNPNSYVNS